MRITKRLLTATLAVVLAMGVLASPTVHAAVEIGVTINGRAVDFGDQPPVMIGGAILVPVRDVFEHLGFAVDWHEPTQTTTFTGPNHTVVISIDGMTFTTNDVEYALYVPAQIINGRIMMPIRNVLESIGKHVGWNIMTRTVVVATRAPLWQIDPQFANNATGGHSLISNGALAQAIRSFYRQHYDQIQGPYVPPVRDEWGWYYYAEIDSRISNGLNDAIRQGWSQESYVALFPQNQLYLDMLLQNVYWQLTHSRGDRYSGWFWPLEYRDTVFVATDFGENEFVFAVLHELMHLFSLDHRRANLVAETLAGFYSSGDLAYNSTFFGTLLDRLQAQSGADGAREFWTAAFGVEQDFADLWNREMSQYVLFEDLQLAAGVYEAKRLGDSGPEAATDLTNRLLAYWRIIHSELHPENNWHVLRGPQQRAAAQQRFSDTIYEIQQYADLHNIQPLYEGLDWVIRQRHRRLANHTP